MFEGLAHAGNFVQINRLAFHRFLHDLFLFKKWYNLCATIWLQFQKRKYANLNLVRCGKKGYGLETQEDISEGRFLIEYVGEVSFATLFWKVSVPPNSRTENFGGKDG